jgi:hypothetical protein
LPPTFYYVSAPFSLVSPDPRASSFFNLRAGVLTVPVFAYFLYVLLTGTGEGDSYWGYRSIRFVLLLSGRSWPQKKTDEENGTDVKQQNYGILA